MEVESPIKGPLFRVTERYPNLTIGELADKLLAMEDVLTGARERIAELEAAARAVVWFDWSDNDPDAVSAIDALRKLVNK